MTPRGSHDLYDRLPAVYRIRDAERGEPLRALLQVIESEFDRIEHDIAGLYDNWFIETCDEWVVPYIGDLLGVRPIRAVPTAGVSTRAYVANTLAYRRRKGTAFVLEQLARDTTGWPAHAVEFFQLLATTQQLNHVRLQPGTTPSIRSAARAELAGSAFDTFAHLPELRRAETRGGRYNVPNIGIYLWRLQSYRMDGVTARRLDVPNRNTFAFHPVGLATPLFNPGAAESDITHLAEEQHVPGRLRRLALHEEFEHARGGSGRPRRFMTDDDPALRVFVELTGSGTLAEVPVARMYACDIPDSVELASPAPLAVAIDADRGRMRFPAALDIARVLVRYNQGFPGDLGGGPYDRRDSPDQALFSEGACDWQVGVSHRGETAVAPAQIFPSLAGAVAAWNALPPGRTGVITLMDSETDGTSGSGSPPASIGITMKEGSRLLVIAAGWPQRDDFTRPFGTFVPSGVRPHIIADFIVQGTAPPGSSAPSALTINGVLVEGSLTVADGNLGTLAVQHSTFVAPLEPSPAVPRLASVRVAAGNDRLLLRLDRTIVGTVQVDVPVRGVEIRDSILAAGLDSPAFACLATASPCSFESSTFEGAVDTGTLSASNCLFTAAVSAVRRQTGCVRFSYVPPDSTTPRRYRCQPDLAIAAASGEAASSEVASSEVASGEANTIRDQLRARIRPLFVSLQYGDAEFGQLQSNCPVELRTGAEDGSEMGAYRFLQQPHREANLRTVLQEYLRFGLEAGTFFVT